VGNGGGGSLLVALPGANRSDAESAREMIASDWRELGRREGFDASGAAFVTAVAVFPSEAVSAEFLFESLRVQLNADPVRGAVEAESDASLLRAGVTAMSDTMRPVYGTLRRVAPTDLPVLLEGETGVGKEVLTDLVHRWSRRAAGPLVKVHCASLSETLLASELFGHERGAFTGADRRRIGRFEQASGGTLFLDEVGEIPMEVQVMLLRALQEGEIDRVGGAESVQIDVRIVAATNRDMKQMVAAGRFREDLYYRLQGMVVVVPPLRERREELPALIERFRAEIIADGHAPARGFSTGALDELYQQAWPGNIRQLRTTVFRAMVLARGAVVRHADVLSALTGAAAVSGAPEQAARLEPRRAESSPASAGGSGDELGPRGSAAGPGASKVDPGIVDPARPASAQAAPGSVEPVVELPAARPADAAPSKGSDAHAEAAADNPERALPRRLQELLQTIRRRGRYTTQEHMAKSGVSHRTALRDLQALVIEGFVERVGVRRGAYYRPDPRLTNSLPTQQDGLA